MRLAIEAEEPRSVAFRKRSLRDEFIGQKVIERRKSVCAGSARAHGTYRIFCFMIRPDENFTAFRAGIGTTSPVFGFRPFFALR